LGDNIFEDDFSDLKLNYYDSWCHIFLKEVPDPERFGVPVFQGMDRHLVKVEEKPEKPMSNYAVTGLYMFNDEVWSVIDTLKPSERGELEVVDLINWYIDRGKTTHSELKGFWSDAGTPDSLVQANKLVSQKEKK
jgi:glucose-1-phosphate thymidylyltransferase